MLSIAWSHWTNQWKERTKSNLSASRNWHFWDADQLERREKDHWRHWLIFREANFDCAHIAARYGRQNVRCRPYWSSLNDKCIHAWRHFNQSWMSRMIRKYLLSLSKKWGYRTICTGFYAHVLAKFRQKQRKFSEFFRKNDAAIGQERVKRE